MSLIHRIFFTILTLFLWSAWSAATLWAECPVAEISIPLPPIPELFPMIPEMSLKDYLDLGDDCLDMAPPNSSEVHSILTATDMPEFKACFCAHFANIPRYPGTSAFLRRTRGSEDLEIVFPGGKLLDWVLKDYTVGMREPWTDIWRRAFTIGCGKIAFWFSTSVCRLEDSNVWIPIIIIVETVLFCWLMGITCWIIHQKQQKQPHDDTGHDINAPDHQNYPNQPPGDTGDATSAQDHQDQQN